MKKKPLKGSIFICIVLIFAAYLYHIWEKDREREAEARETYRQAEELIEQGLYEKADEILEQIRGLQYTELEYTGSAITGGGNLMFSDFDAQTRQMLTGNLLMIGCCAFYLAWWLIAFRPEDAVKGIRSGWLLIPALLFGVAAVTQIVQGSGAVESEAFLFPRNAVLIGGVVVYIVLLVGTSVLLKRQVTTELFLIVGWTTLMFLELNALFAQGQFTKSTVIVFLVMTLIFAVVSMICYLLYYGLDKVKGYVDGMIPLLLAAVMMAVITVGAVISHR